jgi:RHS repeat-associated protein
MKIGIDNGGNWTAEYYEATVVSANDYYAFGSTMAGRKFSSGAYRFGFNGMEKDDEMKGNGNSYDFGARLYDSRVGRWLAVDPLAAEYPESSPYNGIGNNPILFIDADGRDPIIPNITSLTSLIKRLNDLEVTSLYDLVSNYEGIELPGPNNDAPNLRMLDERYVYSKSWGWIDMKHFAKAGYLADRYFVTNERALLEGENIERRQQEQLDLADAGESAIMGMAVSAWSYEDLVSNALGIYFANEYWDGILDTRTLPEALNDFFDAIGVVDNPLAIAPNASTIATSATFEMEVEEKNEKGETVMVKKTFARRTTQQNFTYTPMYTTHKREKGENARIVEFIEETIGAEMDDVRQF